MNTEIQFKVRLKELVENSDTMNSLLPSDRNARIEEMLKSSPEKMRELIGIFEEELREDEKIEEEFALSNEEKAEIRMEKSKNAQRARDEKEKVERIRDLKTAENLLNKIDEIIQK